MQIAILVAIAGLAVLVALLFAYVLRNARMSRAASAASTEIVDWIRAQRPVELDLSTLVEDSHTLAPNDVVVQALGGGRAVVYADEARAREFGTVTGRAAQPISIAARRASSAVESAIEAAKRTGYLVELSPESRRAWLAQEKIRAGGGYVLGVLRDQNTKTFTHILKVKPARVAQTAASGAALLSALATQAQLDRIEKQLGAITSGVSDIKTHLQNRRTAELNAAQRLLAELYAAARAAGALTPAMWDQIAPMAHAIYTLQEESRLALDDLAGKLAGLRSAGVGERREKLKELAREAERLLDSSLTEERAVVQFQILRVWHLAERRDPSLDHALREVAAASERRQESLRAAVDAISQAAADIDKASAINPHIFARRDLRQTADDLRGILDARASGAIMRPTLPSKTEQPDRAKPIEAAGS